MSPTAGAASPAGSIDAVAAQELLDQGETIILAVKPSAWMAVLNSWPVLVVAALVACGAAVAGRVIAGNVHTHFIYLACIGVACVRFMIACGNWMGCLYILTSRRVLSVRGLTKVVIDECPLGRISATRLSATTGERMLSLASLLFEGASGGVMETSWPCLAKAAEVQQAVEQAIRRVR